MEVVVGVYHVPYKKWPEIHIYHYYWYPNMSEKYTIKKQKSMGKIESNISEEDKEKKRNAWRNTKELLPQMFKNKTESNDLKKVEAVVITNFIEDKVKSFSDAEVYINDDYDS